MDSLLELQFNLILYWRDQRLWFRNLKDSEYLNTVTHKEAESIWYPKVVFFNTKEKVVAKVRKTYIYLRQCYILMFFSV